MPGATLRPDASRIQSSGLARTERIERSTLAPGQLAPEHMIFSYPGAMTNGIVSPPWYVPRAGLISLVRVSFTASVSGVQISLNKNGSAVQTFTTTGQTHLNSTEIGVLYGDWITITVISSAGGENMSVDVRLS